MSISDRYDQGDVIQIAGTFKNVNEILTDPTEAILRLLLPDETEVVYHWPTPGAGELAMTHDGVGLFSTLYQPDQAGIVHWRWEGIGAVTAADEDFLIVRVSAFA